MTGPTVFNTDTTHPSCGRPMHAGMTAREHLEVHAHWGFASGEQMRAAIDAYAHELAEQQRAYAAADQKRHRDEHGCDDYEVDMCAEAVREVANLIDPKVTT